MFIHDTENGLPIQIWCASPEAVEEGCMEQAEHLAKLPFAVDHIALMPDTHQGKGMPIGGVLACEGVLIPNAVGVDIGCGMGFVQTNIPVQLLRETMTGSGSVLHTIIGNILRGIPTGRNHYKKPQPSAVLDRAKEEMDKYEQDTALLPFLESGYYQVGTLGGGNHFIELQEDENGMCAIMLHSGSRHFGNALKIIMNTDFDKGCVLWHCTEGKDRCGLVSAFLLTVLGVDEDVIREDYLLTNVVNGPKAEHLYNIFKEMGRSEADCEGIRNVILAKEEYLDAALGRIREKYGTMENFLTAGLHLEPEQMKRFREKMLVE